MNSIGIFVLGTILAIVGILVYRYYELIHLRFVYLSKSLHFHFLEVSHCIFELKCFWLELSIKRSEKRLARSYYEGAQFAYESISYLRREYYKTHFLDDNELKIKKQKDLEEIYYGCINILENPISEDCMNYLSNDEKEILTQLLRAPRYELH